MNEMKADAYTESVMAEAAAEFRRDRPYLRMAREAGVHIETQADCERFKEEDNAISKAS